MGLTWDPSGLGNMGHMWVQHGALIVKNKWDPYGPNINLLYGPQMGFANGYLMGPIWAILYESGYEIKWDIHWINYIHHTVSNGICHQGFNSMGETLLNIVFIISIIVAWASHCCDFLIISCNIHENNIFQGHVNLYFTSRYPFLYYSYIV